MFETKIKKRLSATMLVAALSMLLTGCLVTPGKFDSKLVLNNDNSFSFTYTGEIFFIGLSQMAMMGKGGVLTDFESTPCYDEETYEDRECTDVDISEQKADWEAQSEMRATQKANEAKQMAAMLGGVDPTDPDAGKELAAKLERQHGWNSVEYVGDGVFNVDYAISGMLSHDIVFPVIEGVPVPTPFIQVAIRKGQKIRVNAPGFASPSQGNPMGTGMMTGMMTGMNQVSTEAPDDEGTSSDKAGSGSDAEQGMAGAPKMQGTFSIVTNGKILTNNTDEGPAGSPAGQTLNWKISPATKTGPTALIELGG